jgi:hypothetical protein
LLCDPGLERQEPGAVGIPDRLELGPQPLQLLAQLRLGLRRLIRLRRLGRRLRPGGCREQKANCGYGAHAPRQRVMEHASSWTTETDCELLRKTSRYSEKTTG